MKTRGLLLFDNFFEIAIATLPDKEKRWQVVELLWNYNRTGDDSPPSDPTMLAVYMTGKFIIDHNSEAWESKSEKARQSALARWQSKNTEDMRTHANACEPCERTKTMRTHANDANAFSGCYNININKTKNINKTTTENKTPTPKGECEGMSNSSNQPQDAPKPSRTTKRTIGQLQQRHPKAVAFWQAVRAVYPSNLRRAPSEGILQIIDDKKLWERQDEIVATVKRFSTEDDNWRRGYAPAMPRFFEEERYENEPTPPKPPETVRKIFTTQAEMPHYTDDSDVPELP